MLTDPTPRIRRMLMALSLNLLITASQAQPSDALKLNGQAIRAHAEFLSSDLLEGRATGSRGYELAAAYVAAQFRQYGLSAAGDGDNYLQVVPLIEANAVLPGSAATLKRDGSTLNFEFGKDYLPSANFFNANSSLTAPLAFAGYGIEAPELKYNDFTDLDLQGRIAIIMNGAPERFNAQARSYYAWRDTKYASLVKQGALGVIEVEASEPKDNRDALSYWDRASAASWISEMHLVNSQDEADERFPELKAKFRFNLEAAAALLGNGHSVEQLLQNAKNNEPISFALPGLLTLSTTTGIRRVDSNNVVAMIRGSDARLQNEYVLVAAQLDHLGRGAAVNGDNIYNGLQRNAVGVAMMLEMARSLAAQPVRPRRSILFAAVTAGEKGAQGLQYLLTTPPRNIVAGVVLATPLPLTRTTDVIAVGADQSSLGGLLASAGEAQGLRIVTVTDPQYALTSDTLAPLMRANIPVVTLHGGLRAKGRVDARALQRDWLRMHMNQPSDDIHNAPLDVLAARDLTELNTRLIMLLANAEERPSWYRSSLMHRKLN